MSSFPVACSVGAKSENKGLRENIGLRPTKALQDGNLYLRMYFNDIPAMTGIIKSKPLK
jgi:hypothetical protein